MILILFKEIIRLRQFGAEPEIADRNAEATDRKNWHGTKPVDSGE
jgi:hypothetical protein